VDLPPLVGPVSIRCRRVHSQLVRGWGLEARHSSPWRLIFCFWRALVNRVPP